MTIMFAPCRGSRIAAGKKEEDKSLGRSSGTSNTHGALGKTGGLVAAALMAVSVLSAQTPAGRWDAHVTKIGSLRVPFTMHFDGSGSSFAASCSIVMGDTRIRSSSASFDGKTARADFENPGSHMQAVVADGGSLTGTFGNEKLGMHPFRASAFCTCGLVGEAGPEIMGPWEVSENNWKLSVRRVGEDTMATISRGGAEIGPISGRFNGSFFELSLFDGNQAAVLEIEPRKDGALDLSWMEPGVGVKKLKAVKKL